ncbi:MAG TPA: hypothetical protein VNC22_08410 [Sporichthya sp.]|nr:hypothetical protein [Sporichthya sp.]
MAKTFFPQQRQLTCVVAALRSVLATQFGVAIREDLLRFAGDDAQAPIVKFGAGTGQIRQMLDVANRAANTGPRWRLRVRQRATVADLAREVRDGRVPMAHIAIADRDDIRHMVVVCGYRPGRVRYFDPATGRRRWVGAGAFRAVWLDPTGATWLAVVTDGR